MSRFAQAFTAQNTGSLIRADALIAEPPAATGTFQFHIVTVDGAGVPTNNALASTTVPDSQVPDGESIVTAVFATPAQVTAGERYGLVVTRPGGTTLLVGVRQGNPCPSRLFVSLTQTGPFEPQSEPEDFDLVFRTFVDVPPVEAPSPPAKADGTLTIDANKGKVEKGRKVTLSGQLDVAANESCEQNRQIQIQRRLKSEDDSKFQTFATVQTDAAGNFSLRTKVKKTRFFRAIVGETDACDDETSSSQKVRVQKPKAAQEA